MVNQEQIDAWYENRKKKLFEEFSKKLEQKKPDAEQTYRAEMNKIRLIYGEKSDIMLRKEMSKYRNETEEAVKKVSHWWSRIVELFNEK